jgi:hypothetical protein
VAAAASRSSLAIQMGDRMRNKQFLTKILSAQGDAPATDRIPFLIADNANTNVSEKLLELYGSTPAEWTLALANLKTNLNRIANWIGDALRCDGVQQIVVYFTDGEDIEYVRHCQSVETFAEFCYEKIVEEPSQVPSIAIVVS